MRRAARYLPGIAALLLGVGLSLVAYALTASLEVESRAKRFSQDAAVYAVATRVRLERIIGAVESLARLYASSNRVTADEYARFTQPYIARDPLIQALAWVPSIAAHRRVELELMARREVDRSFRLRDWPGAAGVRLPPGEPTLPVFRAEPAAAQTALLGADLRSQPALRAAAERAIATGGMAMSAPITLVLQGRSAKAVGILVPSSKPDGAEDDHEPALRGFAFGLARIDALAAEVSEGLPSLGVELRVQDGGALRGRQDPPQTQALPGTAGISAAESERFAQQLVADLGGRTWLLTAQPSPGTRQAAVWPLSVLMAGVSLSVLLAALVQARALAVARALEREAQLGELIRHAPACLAVLDRELRFLGVSDRWTQDTGVDRDALIGVHYDAVFPDHPDHWRAARRRALLGEATCVEADPFGWSDGAQRWVKWEVRPWCDDGDRIAGVGIVLEDVTARLESERRLREKLALQDQLAKVASSVPGVVCSLQQAPDGARSMPFASPAIRDLLGLSPEALAADFEPFAALIATEDAPRMIEALEASARSLTVWDQELRAQHPERGPIWLAVRCIPGGTPDGTIVWHGFIQDVTARKQSELELQRFRQIVEASSEKLLFVDTDLRIHVVNPAYASLHEATPAALSGRHVRDVLGDEGYRDIEVHLLAAMAGRVRQFRIDRLCPNGDRHHFEAEYRPCIVDGAVQGVVVTLHDATEATQARAALEAQQAHLEELVAARTRELQASEAQARLILDSSADAIYGIDVDGRVTFVNPAACRLLGYTPDALLGRGIHRLIHHSRADGSPYPAGDCAIVSALRGEDACVARVDDEVFWKADGTALPVSYAAHPMQRDGRMIGAVVSFMDISVQKAVEAARDRALQEAERLAAVRSAFLANMSHEIRTPLNGVLGLAQIGLRESAGRKIRATFDSILSSGQHLVAIVDEILDFSKIEAGKLELELSQMSVGGLIDRVVGLIAPRASGKGLGFCVQESADLPAHIRGDSVRLAQVLINLLSNAVKFTELGEVALSVRREGASLVFTVTDTGIGMSEAQLDRIFAPFEQADESTTRKFGGTGLGLAISHQLVALMGGEILAESREGEGSRFEARVPLIGADAPLERAAGSVALLGRVGADADCLVAAMASYGISVVRAPASEIPDVELVIVDVADVTPELLARLRSHRPRARVVALDPAREVPDWLASQIPVLEPPVRARHVRDVLAGEEPRSPRPLPHGCRLRGFSVLAAEDNDVSQLVLEQSLQAEGATVTMFGTGQALLEHLEEAGASRYDVLLTDIQMPGVDGYTVARECRVRYPGLPIIGLTAHAMRQERERCLEAGMVEHLSKPVDLDRLAEAIRQHAKAGDESAAGRRRADEVPPSEGAELRAREWPGVADSRSLDDGMRRAIAALGAAYGAEEGILERLVSAFLETCDDASRELRRALECADLEAVRRTAHSVKGMAANFLFPELSDMAEAAEQAARSRADDAEAIAARLAGVLEAVARLRPDVQSPA